MYVIIFFIEKQEIGVVRLRSVYYIFLKKKNNEI